MMPIAKGLCVGARDRRAFTILELMLVICIIMVIIGIFVPTYALLRDKARTVTDKLMVKQLESAFKAYLECYNIWPPGIHEPDQVVGVPLYGPLLDMLAGKIKTDPDFPNPQGYVFFEFTPRKGMVEAATTAYDAWSPRKNGLSTAYRVKFDLDYNNVIALGDIVIRRSVAVWSVGPDGIPATEDDIRSWE